MDYPAPVWPALPSVSPFHPESLGGLLRIQGVALASCTSAAFTGGKAYFYPFRVYDPAVAVKMSYIVGATASGNVDLGIYDAQGNRLVSSGAVAQGAVNSLQELDIADTLLLPGVYYMAIAASTASATGLRVSLADEDLLSKYPALANTAAAHPLPASASWGLDTGTTILVWAMAVHFDTLV